MDLFSACYKFIFTFNQYLAIPSVILFLGTGILLTFLNKFPQIRAFRKFLDLINFNIHAKSDQSKKTLSPFQALFTAMASTIGMGNIVGPSMAIAIGGPGALFWLILYIFFGSVTKFTEVTYSVAFRKTSPTGDIIGGPGQYLKKVVPFLGVLYAALTVLLFTIWSSIQVNTISCIAAREGVPNWISGIIAVTILLAVILGGVKRIGNVMSKIVPIKFLLYVGFALIILLKNPVALAQAVKTVFSCAFNPGAACGGLIGATIFMALREGIYKAIFITESGLGTASIAQALSSVKKPVEQGILAMYSGIAEILLCCLSGLVTLVTGVWLSKSLSNTLIYEAFKTNSPIPGGQVIFLVAIFLFVMTAVIGNTFNGGQSFASLTNYKYMKFYYFCAAAIAFSGALVAMPFLWNLMDIILAFVAIPNLIGLIILTLKYPTELKF